MHCSIKYEDERHLLHHVLRRAEQDGRRTAEGAWAPDGTMKSPATSEFPTSRLLLQEKINSPIWLNSRKLDFQLWAPDPTLI